MKPWCWGLVMMPLMAGCRDDIVLKLPLRGKVGEPVDKTLEAKVGVDYQFWSDYQFVSPADAPGDR